MGKKVKNKEKEKSFRIQFIRVGDQSGEIIKGLVSTEMKNALAKHGVIAYNLDEVLSKYITGEM